MRLSLLDLFWVYRWKPEHVERLLISMRRVLGPAPHLTALNLNGDASLLPCEEADFPFVELFHVRCSPKTP